MLCVMPPVAGKCIVNMVNFIVMVTLYYAILYLQWFVISTENGHIGLWLNTCKNILCDIFRKQRH